MIRRIVTVTAVFICVLGGGIGTLNAQTPSGQVDAYVMVIKAEQAEKNGNIDEAIDYYNAAVKLYQDVQVQTPDWRPELVRYRIADSLNHVERLKRKAGSKDSKPPQEEPEAVEQVHQQPDTSEEMALLHEKEAALLEQNQQLKLRTQKLEQQIESLRADVEQNQKETGKQRDEANNTAALTKEVEQLTALNKQLSEAGERLALQVKDLTTINENLIKAGKNDSRSVGGDEIKKAVQEAVGPLKDEIAGLKNELKALEGERDGLKEQLVDQKERALEEQDKLVKPLERRIADLEKERMELTDLLEQARNDLALRSSESDPELDALNQNVNKLTLENEALKETIDLNFAEMERVREYKSEIKTLKKSNSKLSREIEDLQKEMEKSDLSEEYERIVSQNNVLVDEVQSFRKRLESSEKQIRTLERALSKKSSD